MIFIFFTVIVFIAEIIIVFAILFNLIKFDIYINRTNELLVEAKPKIQEIMELVHRFGLKSFVKLEICL